MQVYGCQWNIVWEDKPANFARLRALLAEASPAPGSLVILPEMFATGFSMNVAGISEEPGGGTSAFLSALACEWRCTVLGGVVARAADGRGSNEAVAFTPDGSEAARYRKLHPFSYSGETLHYAPGDRLEMFEWQGVRVAPFICYDLRFPEGFRAAVQRGAGLFAVIANWPAAREDHWLTLLRARAIENQAYVVGVNRCGADPALAYSGHSLIVGPRGEILADAGSEETVISTTVDPEALASYRAEFPALADIRPIPGA